MTFSAPIIWPMFPSPTGYAIEPVATIVPWPTISRGTAGDGADPARVGQRQVAAAQVVGAQGVRARLLDERVVGVEELR